MAVDLLPKLIELRFRQAPFNEGAGIDARRRVPLDEHQITAVALAWRVPEVIEADVIQGSAGGEARDVAAQLAGDLVGAHDHSHSVPANDRPQPPLNGRNTGITLLLRRQKGVDVGSVR